MWQRRACGGRRRAYQREGLGVVPGTRQALDVAGAEVPWIDEVSGPRPGPGRLGELPAQGDIASEQAEADADLMENMPDTSTYSEFAPHFAAFRRISRSFAAISLIFAPFARDGAG